MVAAIKRPGWIRGALGALAFGAFGFGLVIALRAISGLPLYQTEQTGYPHVVVPLILAPLGFLAGFGCFDYWLRWAARDADDPRRPLPARRQELEGLLPLQHRSQGDRHPVHRHHLLLLLRRRPDGDADPGRAGPAGHADRRRRDLQQPLLDPRGADDLRLRHPGLRRDRQLRAAADDRRPGHGLPAPQRAQLLDAAAGRPALHRQLPRPGRRLRRRLDRLRAALDRRPARAVVLQPRRPVRGRLLDRDRAQLPGHDHHHAGAGDDLLADAAAGLGQPLDLAAGRRRDPVHRRRPVHGPLRPHPPHQLLRVRAPAATSSATSTSSGSTRTRPSTS